MKQRILFIVITVLLLSSCVALRNSEKPKGPIEPNYLYPVYFNNDSFYYWKGYDVYFSRPDYKWTSIKPPTPKKK